MAEQQQYPKKRPKLETKAKDAASTDDPAAACEPPMAADEQPQQQQALPAEQQQQTLKKRKPVVMPTPIRPPALPADPVGGAWDNAVLLIDKPQGWTSFDVCGKLRGALARLLGRRPRDIKVGHAGTLDPMATGLLIVCVGKGTKAVDSFMAMRKEYSGTLRLGEGTDTYDAEGEVVERQPWEHITDEALAAAREGLTGDLQQLPPMHSAIRVGGQRLYEAARAGRQVDRTPRAVTVDVFEVRRDISSPRDVHFRVCCSKGTYIRSLAHDLGHALGSAAHLTALRREANGEHSVAEAWRMDDLLARIAEQRQAQIQEAGNLAALSTGQ